MNAQQLRNAGAFVPAHIPDYQVMTKEVFGHKTDFEISQKRVGENAVMTVTAVFPEVRFDGRHFVSFAPPRYPWPCAESPR